MITRYDTNLEKGMWQWSLIVYQMSLANHEQLDDNKVTKYIQVKMFWSKTKPTKQD